MTIRHGVLDDQPVLWHEAPDRTGDEAPVLYLHGVPTCADDWAPFLERTGGLAPDLPGFGRSGKRADLAYDLPFYDCWLERFLAWREIERVRLVMHDWGVVGLLWAQRFPERVERLVIVNGVPLLPGYRWHGAARLWRTPVAGEILMGATGGLVLRRFAGLPEAIGERAARHFDLGTQRAILRLYRSAPPDVLERAGARLGGLTCPALVVWGDKDRYVASDFAERYGRRLPASEIRHFADAGHWPWIDRPDVVDVVAAFLAAGS